MFTKIFFSPDERRLRAGWRILLQLSILAAITSLLGLLWSVGRLIFGLQPTLNLAESGALTAIAVTLAVWLGRLWLDRRTFASLGLQPGKPAWRDLLAGFLISGVIMLLVYAIERLAGWLTMDAVAWQRLPAGQIALSFGMMIVAFIVVGWEEELYFRGYLLQNLRDGLKLFWAVILSSMIFGAAHLQNPNSLVMSAAGVFLAGLLLAMGYLRTGQLWLPIGLHIGWNLFEGPVLGFPVSGLDTFRLFQTTVNGPALLTGGAFGPEAGLVLLPALAVGAGLIWIYTLNLKPRSAVSPE